MNFKAIHDIAIPINKHGSQKKDFPEQINNAFESENQIMIFPAGMCSRYTFKKGICDLKWTKTFITRSIEHQRDIIPVYFEGRNSIFFYVLAYLREKLGVKLNIEMLFLPHEMFSHKHRTYKIHIGKPIPWKSLDQTKSPIKLAQEVKEVVYKLRKR
jgi:putative hemolysin